jgi:hypothetical protein
MTITQTMSDRTHDRQVTRLKSALQAVREEVAQDPPKLGKMSNRWLTYGHHGFQVHINVDMEPMWSLTCTTAEAIDSALNMAIGRADRLSRSGEFNFVPRRKGRVMVQVWADIASV